MKKLAVILMLILAFQMCAFADQVKEGMLPSSLAASYVVWAELLGVTEVSEEYDTESYDDDTSILNVDDCAVSYSKHSLEFQSAFLYYKYSGCLEIDMDLRALAFFIAFEYGAPTHITGGTVKEAKQMANTILNQMKQTMEDKKSYIQNGEMVPFYVGKKVTYSIFQTDDDLIVYVE